MRWFDRWFARKWRWAWDNRDAPDILDGRKMGRVAMPQDTIAIEESPSWGDGLRMNVRKIIGGYVVSFRIYDRRTDRSDDRHYMITDEQDFNTELGKMITLESMRQT